MNMYHTDAYRTAFLAYLRNGKPISLSLKQLGATDQYVWRTQRDERVRRSHRINDGRIFSWSDPPSTGHPGEDFSCRCEAIPYIPGQTEFAFHDFTTGLASSTDRWTDTDFVNHYYFGGGRSVDLLEIGHLREIAEQYAWNDGAQGAFRRLTDQIADAARRSESGSFSYDFEGVYDFGNVEFSHGDGVVRGVFSGTVESRGVMLQVRGSTEFEFSDIFEDPLGLGIEVGGTPYSITGSWSADFTAEVFRDAGRSDYSALDGG